MKTRICAVLLSVFVLSSLFGGVEIVYSQKKQFRLPCTVISGPGGLKEIEIWVTGDNGKHWKKGAVRKSGQPVLVFAVKQDGTYGFKTVAVGKNDLRQNAPSKGDSPDLVYIVDSKKPEVEILSSKPSHVLDPGEPIRLQWSMKDKNIDEKKCIVSYSKNGGETWENMAGGVLEGKRTFSDSAGLTHIMFRVYAVDKAGNEHHRIQAFFFGSKASPVKSDSSDIQEDGETEISFSKEKQPGKKTPKTPVSEDKQPEIEKPVKPVHTDNEKKEPEKKEEIKTEQLVTLIDNEGGFSNKVITIEDTEGDSPVIEVPLKKPANEEIVFIDREPESIPAKPVKPVQVTKPVVKPKPVRAEDSLDGKAVLYCDYAVEKEVFGDFTKAEKYYLEALKREPKYYRARKGLAELYLRYEKYSNAKRAFSSLLKINPDSADLRVKYALSVYKSGGIIQAEKEFKKVLLMNPGNNDAMWYLSKLYKENGKMKDALIMWIQIRKKGPENNKWHDFAKNYISIYESKIMR